MARLPRLILPDQPHHVILRGNNRQAIFYSDLDREYLLATLAEAAGQYRVAVHAYVLMDNHLHLLVTPPAADALSRMMQSLGRRYVGWFNARHQRSGTLWEGRFRAGVVEGERHLLACMRYIELNPVRAGLCGDAAQWPWSSAAYQAPSRGSAMASETLSPRKEVPAMDQPPFPFLIVKRPLRVETRSVSDIINPLREPASRRLQNPVSRDR